MDAYKEKEYDVRKIIEETLSIPDAFENYVKDVDSFIDYQIKSYIELSNKQYLLEQRYNATIKELKKIIYELQHNPRTNAETRDKYIIEKLNYLVGDTNIKGSDE